MFRTSCAATLCFIPGIFVQTQLPAHQVETPTWPTQPVRQVGIVVPPITVSEHQPTRVLTEAEHTILNSALLRSTTVIADGFLSV